MARAKNTEIGELSLCLVKTPSSCHWEIARWSNLYKDREWRTIHNSGVVGKVILSIPLPNIALGEDVDNSQALDEIKSDLESAEKKKADARQRSAERRAEKKSGVKKVATMYD